MLRKHDADPQENKVALQLYHQNHTYAQIRARKFAAHTQNTLLRESTFEGLLLKVKQTLKDLNRKKFLFTVLNLLALKMNEQTNK